jgi:hypothetical protein
MRLRTVLRCGLVRICPQHAATLDRRNNSSERQQNALLVRSSYALLPTKRWRLPGAVHERAAEAKQLLCSGRFGSTSCPTARYAYILHGGDTRGHQHLLGDVEQRHGGVDDGSSALRHPWRNHALHFGW